MIRIALIGALAILAPSAPRPALAQVASAAQELSAAKTLWLGRNYQQAYRALLILRGKPYGRRVEVDFMLATSACQIGYRPYALKVLTNILSRYSLTPRAQQGVQAQIANCAPNNATIVIVSAAVPTTSGGWGKTYFWLDKRLPVTSYPARRQRDVDPAALSARLVRRGTPFPAAQMRREGCTVTTGTYVVLCSLSPAIPRARQRAIVAEADAFVDFLRTQYGIAPADEFVTMRLVPDVARVRRLAASLHGLDVSEATIAYSFQDDLSLVAVSSGTSGSVLHELAHLALRRDFGDAPQWLEEGIASLYEVSVKCQGQFYGLDNWRGDLLRRDQWPAEPSFREVLDQKWFQLVTDEAGAETVPATPSMSFEYERAIAEAKMRYFAFYLQDQGKLSQIYAALKAGPADAEVLDHQDAVLRSVLVARYADLDDTLHSFTTHIKTHAPRQLGADCQANGIEIRKDIPTPPQVYSLRNRARNIFAPAG